MPIVSFKKNPFLDDESAIAALGNYIDERNRISRGGMYLLNITTTLINNGKEIFERIPSQVFSGLQQGGRRNVQAALICRSQDPAGPSQQGKVLESGYTREQELIGNWAERDGCWLDEANAHLESKGYLHDSGIDGSESMVYFEDQGGSVHKVIDHVRYDSLERLLDRIHIHNAIFPECPMVIEAFGMRDYSDDNTGFSAVIRQPFVKGTTPSDEDIAGALEARGLHCADKGAGWFYTDPDGTVLITDVHDLNAVKTESGRVIFFDCEARVNDVPSLGGKFNIPALKYSKESAAEICTIIDALAPSVRSEEHIIPFLDNPELRRKELDATGRINGPVELDSGETVFIQRVPGNRGMLLVSTPEKIRKVLSFGIPVPDDGTPLTEKEMSAMVSGRGFRRGDTYYSFDLDKGRITECTEFRLTLRHTITRNHKLNI